jgi:hypothetical protein
MGAKKVNYILIEKGEEPYQVLAEAMVFHDDLCGARIAMAWRIRNKADPDGHIVLGKCVKVSDLNKEFADFDFIIVLNKEYWLEFDDKQKLALVDHELCHAAPKVSDETGEHIHDERGRKVWRIAKHDLEEFLGIVRRHGCWKRDLERFAEAIEKKRKSPVFTGKEAAANDAPEETPTISINMDARCTKCKQMGATPSGLCIGCIAERIGESAHAVV